LINSSVVFPIKPVAPVTNTFINGRS
jgi:hypothetical protein